VSKLNWTPLASDGRFVVVTNTAIVSDRWHARACAAITDSAYAVRDVVRDILANPQVRAVVFDGPALNRAEFDKFWLGENDISWRIDKEHLDLVRQFVDLFDDDCMWRVPPQPFWPARVMYLEEMEAK